jgi:hypothetical protein
MIHVESLAITPRPWLTSYVSSKSPQTGHRDTSWVQMQVSHAPYVNHVTVAGFDCHPPKRLMFGQIHIDHHRSIMGHIWGNTECCMAVSLNCGIPIPEEMGFCTWKLHIFGWFWDTLYMRFRTPPLQESCWTLDHLLCWCCWTASWQPALKCPTCRILTSYLWEGLWTGEGVDHVKLSWF